MNIVARRFTVVERIDTSFKSGNGLRRILSRSPSRIRRLLIADVFIDSFRRRFASRH